MPLQKITVLLRRVNRATEYVTNYFWQHCSKPSDIWRIMSRATRAFRIYGLKQILKNIDLASGNISYETEFIAPLGLKPSLYPGQCPVKLRTSSVDVVVCVHNALEDVKQCLGHLVRNTRGNFHLIIVDDGSDSETASFLEKFGVVHAALPTLLIRNNTPNGYTLAANQGMKASTGDYVVLLNSDTVVSPEWLDRMVMCAEASERVGIVGPLSNTASWQSIPEIETNGDWAANDLPPGLSIEEFANTIARTSACLYPPMGFLNGFCLLIKQSLIKEIGLFDEENFSRGYGEENDFCLRARKAGWLLLLADDVYVFHAQSKSYSSERRKQLGEIAGKILSIKHGDAIISEGVRQCRQNRILEGIRARAQAIYEIQTLKDYARHWLGKRVCYILPSDNAGGGSNVIVTEARALRSFGIEATIVNLQSMRTGFEASYPEIGIPVLYATSIREVAEIASKFDAAIATHNMTVEWLSPLAKKSNNTVLGYYVQDYEPYFYSNPSDIQRARDSYTLIKSMVLFTKTEWNYHEVLQQTKAECRVIGPSVDIWLFRPRPHEHPAWPSRPLRISAMIRPISPRRAPALTMKVLGECARILGNRIEIVLFGVAEDDPQFLALPRSFAYRHVGRQRPDQLASLFNEVDIFVDFSEFQAMGLTAMEAMACGVATIVPSQGGAVSYAKNNKNCLIIDTKDHSACVSSLLKLIENDQLRLALQRQAIIDMGEFSPEKAAFNMLQVLFDSAG